jgi:hypothetical protein
MLRSLKIECVCDNLIIAILSAYVFVAGKMIIHKAPSFYTGDAVRKDLMLK